MTTAMDTEERKMKTTCTANSAFGGEPKTLTFEHAPAPVFEEGRIVNGKIQWNHEGKRLTGGVPWTSGPDREHEEATVQFGNLALRVSTRPHLQVLRDWVCGLHAAQASVRKEFWSSEWKEAESKFLARLPAGSVSVRSTGEREPDPLEAGLSLTVWSSEDGRKFAGDPDEQLLGRIGWVDSARLDELSSSYAAEKDRDRTCRREHREAAAARREALRAVVVPPGALADYRRYRGDAEAAWSVEDESAWSSIMHYGAAIEEQGLDHSRRPDPPDGLDQVPDNE